MDKKSYSRTQKDKNLESFSLDRVL